MIIIDENNAIAGGAPEVIFTELTLAIRLTREHLRDTLPCLDADNLVREAIRMGMMTDEDFDKVLDGQREEILSDK